MSHLDPDQLALIALGEPVASDEERATPRVVPGMRGRGRGDDPRGRRRSLHDRRDASSIRRPPASGTASPTNSALTPAVAADSFGAPDAEILHRASLQPHRRCRGPDPGRDPRRPTEPGPRRSRGPISPASAGTRPAEPHTPPPLVGVLWVLAASMALVARVGAGVWIGFARLAPTPIATAALEAFPAHPEAVGTAEVEESRDGTRTLTVTLEGEARRRRLPRGVAHPQRRRRPHQPRRARRHVRLVPDPRGCGPRRVRPRRHLVRADRRRPCALGRLDRAGPAGVRLMRGVPLRRRQVRASSWAGTPACGMSGPSSYAAVVEGCRGGRRSSQVVGRRSPFRRAGDGCVAPPAGRVARHHRPRHRPDRHLRRRALRRPAAAPPASSRSPSTRSSSKATAYRETSSKWSFPRSPGGSSSGARATGSQPRRTGGSTNCGGRRSGLRSRPRPCSVPAGGLRGECPHAPGGVP